MISSTRRTETPARYISIRASSTEDSLQRYLSMVAVSKETPFSLGNFSSTAPAVVWRFHLLWPEQYPWRSEERSYFSTLTNLSASLSSRAFKFSSTLLRTKSYKSYFIKSSSSCIIFSEHFLKNSNF